MAPDRDGVSSVQIRIKAVTAVSRGAVSEVKIDHLFCQRVGLCDSSALDCDRQASACAPGSQVFAGQDARGATLALLWPGRLLPRIRITTAQSSPFPTGHLALFSFFDIVIVVFSQIVLDSLSVLSGLAYPGTRHIRSFNLPQTSVWIDFSDPLSPATQQHTNSHHAWSKCLSWARRCR